MSNRYQAVFELVAEKAASIKGKRYGCADHPMGAWVLHLCDEYEGIDDELQPMLDGMKQPDPEYPQPVSLFKTLGTSTDRILARFLERGEEHEQKKKERKKEKASCKVAGTDDAAPGPSTAE